MRKWLGYLCGALASGLVLGCASAPRADDAHAAPTRTITWVMVENPNAVCGNLIPGRALWSIDACADWRDANNCVIYARPPSDESDRQSMFRLGHEVLHCFVGDFHNPSSPASIPKARRQELPQPVSDHVDADNGHEKRNAGKHADPVFSG